MTAPVDNNGGGGGGSTNVRVVARIRPMAKYEIANGSKDSVTSLATIENHHLDDVYDPNTTECLQVVENGQKRFFELDRVFAQECTQDEIYKGCGARYAVTQELFKGFNCTILAYGQTGAGKTFTMGTASAKPDGGISDTDGMIPRAVKDLFDTIQQKCDGNAKVEMSYLEIYNEEIRDLMCMDEKPPKLIIRERLNGEVYVQGSTYRPVGCAADISRAMEEASNRRVVASTAMNAVSSRSHAICTLRIQGVLENDDKFSSKLTLVDLAGSERIKKTGAQGNRRQEGININKGLFVLGQVVSALSDAGRSGGGIKRKPPYRDSKLTRMLQDSLGGNSRTIMVACCSPADYNTEETINTLRYATSARNIKNTATRNLVKQISPEEAMKLARENTLLKKQIAELRALLEEAQAYGAGGAGGGGHINGPSPPSPPASPKKVVGGISSTSSNGGDTSGTITASTSSSSLGKSDDDDEASEGAASQQSSSGNSSSGKDEEIKLDGPAPSVAEVPALHMEIASLKERVKELEEVEQENMELRQDLSDAQNDAEAARKAASQLSDIMEKINLLKEDEIDKKRVQYAHKKKEEQWIDFVHRMLQQQGQQLVKLWYDFELVQRLVTQPIVIKQIGDKTYAVRPKLAYQQKKKRASRKRWWDLKDEEIDENDPATMDEVNDPDEYQMHLLREHIDFFKGRMREAQMHVERECDDLQDMKKSLKMIQDELLDQIGTDEMMQEAVNREENILDQLTTMLLQPAAVLSVLGDDRTIGASTIASRESIPRGPLAPAQKAGVPKFINMGSGGNTNGNDVGLNDNDNDDDVDCYDENVGSNDDSVPGSVATRGSDDNADTANNNNNGGERGKPVRGASATGWFSSIRSVVTAAASADETDAATAENNENNNSNQQHQQQPHPKSPRRASWFAGLRQEPAVNNEEAEKEKKAQLKAAVERGLMMQSEEASRNKQDEAPARDQQSLSGKSEENSTKPAPQKPVGWFSRVRNRVAPPEQIQEGGDSHADDHQQKEQPPIVSPTSSDGDASHDVNDAERNEGAKEESENGSMGEEVDEPADGQGDGNIIPCAEAEDDMEEDPLADLLMTREWEPKQHHASVDEAAQDEAHHGEEQPELQAVPQTIES